MHRIIRIILLIVFALLMIGFIFLGVGYRLVTRSLPETSGSVHCPGLQSAADVFRSDWGIPYVLAENEADLFFLQGYITARDRFFQMDLQRHLAGGRLSDLLRVNGLKTDTLMQGMDLAEKARADFTRLPAGIQWIFRQYADGINAYLHHYQDKLPLEYTLLNHRPDPWQPEESLGLLYLHVWQRHPAGLLREWIRLRESESARSLPDLLNEGFLEIPLPANLSWMISSEKSASGKPVLAVLYHDPAVVPNVWYEIHLFSPGLRAGGLSLPGVPMILTGQNGAVAWASLVRQRWDLDPGSGLGDGLTHIRNLNRIMRSSAGTDLPETDPSWLLFRADTLGGMHSVLRFQPDGAAVPDWIAADGAWTIMHGDSIPFNAWQLRRLSRLLNADSAWTPLRTRRLQSDCGSVFAADVVSHALPVLEPIRHSRPAADRLIDKWSAWNGEMRPGSAEALVFHTWMAQLALQDPPDPLLDRVPQITSRYILETVKQGDKPEKMQQCFVDAIRLLQDQWGDDMAYWSWGAARRVWFRHPLRGNPLLDMVMHLGPFHLGGSAAALCGAGHPISDPEHIRWTQSARFIADLGDMSRTFSALSTGQSGQPVDPHYRDQIALFLAHDIHPNLNDIQRIRRSGWEQLTLNPGGNHDE